MTLWANLGANQKANNLMKTKLFPLAIALGFAAASLRADVPTGNFWHNPTFEALTGGLPDGWNQGGSDVTIDQVSTANSVSATHSLAVIDPGPGFGEWYSDFALAGFANAGDTIGLHWHEIFSIDSGNEMRVTVRFLDGGGGGPNSGDHHFVVSGNSSGWNTTLADSTFSVRDELSGGNAGVLGPLVVPADAVYLRIQLASGGPENLGGQYIIDDLSAYVVPEPSTIALLSVGGLVVLLRRRKRVR